MIRGFILAMILVAFAYALGFILFVSLLPAAPSAPPHADGVVVLTGGDTRLDKAASLFEQGIAKRMLVSGVGQATTRDTLKALMHGGARFDCCVDMDYAAEDTHGNAEQAADWTRRHGFKSLVLVTARYHMPRSLREFHNLMPDVTLDPYPVDESGIDLSGWWRHQGTVLLLHREYLKYLASLVTTSIT
jgi:uncharacterized SAM-binding protein YcdF (DUF218 family)